MLQANSMDIIGKKFKPVDDPAAKEWFTCYFDQDAQAALDDITTAEPCIYITADGIFTATRLKRRLCKGSSPPKTVKDLEKLLTELKPDAPIVSIGWHKEPAPSPNAYNLLLAGPGFSAPVLSALPEGVAHVESASPEDIYAAFVMRRSNYLVNEAEKMIDQMIADVQKGEANALIYSGSMKHAKAARENSLMKKVYCSSDKKKFVDAVRAEGDVEMHVIEGNGSEKFKDYGGIVFELFYRTDLEMFI